MNRTLLCSALTAGLVFVTARPAAADYPSALVLGTGYATGPIGWTPWTNLPNLEDSLWILGSVAGVNAPFADVVPAGPHELTYVFESYACVWSAHADDLVCSVSEIAIFDLGRIRVYLDLSPDADFANPATFRDGELVLVADAHPLQLFQETHCVNGVRHVQRAVMTMTGGTWFPLVSDDGVGFTGGNFGEFRGDIPAGLSALGYVGQSESRIDILVPTAIHPTTWGRVKALYR